MTDEEIGRRVREIAEQFGISRNMSANMVLSGHVLIGYCHKMDSEVCTLTFDGMEREGKRIGDWEVVIRRKAPSGRNRRQDETQTDG